jgi:hypothetical protein
MIIIRLLIGILLPITIGSIIFAGIAFASELKGNINIPELPLLVTGLFVMGLFIFPFAMIFVGIQSIVYSLLMEFVINPWIKNNFVAIMVSILLGTLSGYVLKEDLLALIGAIVGLIVGVILRSMYSFEPSPDIGKQSRHQH